MSIWNNFSGIPSLLDRAKVQKWIPRLLNASNNWKNSAIDTVIARLSVKPVESNILRTNSCIGNYFTLIATGSGILEFNEHHVL